MKGEGEEEEQGQAGGMYRREERKKKKKSSSLEVELVLQSLLSLCSEWKREEEEGGRLWPKPRSLILIK